MEKELKNDKTGNVLTVWPVAVASKKERAVQKKCRYLLLETGPQTKDAGREPQV